MRKMRMNEEPSKKMSLKDHLTAFQYANLLFEQNDFCIINEEHIIPEEDFRI